MTTGDSFQANFIIAGGGTAGCVLADRLSACGRHKVLVLEAGDQDRNPWIHIPIGYGKITGHPRLDWRLQTVPQPALNCRRVAVPRGRVLGGSSSTNGLLYIRGQAEDYDEWAAAGNVGWSYADVLPYFRRAEDQQHGEDAYHGSGGPLAVRDPVDRHELCEAFIRACEDEGIPRTRDFNGADQEGAGYYQMNVRGVRRCSTAAAYLRRARRRPNLKVLTGAVVERILFDWRRAVGVSYRRGGRPYEARTSGEVILSGGAIASPQLLMVSGVGDAEMLQPKGIPVVLDLLPVGSGLQDHLNVRSVYRASMPITFNDRLGTFLGRMKAGAQYLLQGSGPLTVAAGYAGAFYRGDGQPGRPDTQGYFLLFSTDASGKKLRRESGFMTSAYQLRPKSRGAVRLADPDPAVMPLIDPAYLQNAEDQAVTLQGLRRLREVMGGPAMRPYLAGEGEPLLRCSDEELLDHVRAHASAGHHFSSSCRMGVGGDAVVDMRLRVRGLQGLRVIDASIMPALVSGNTNAPVIMIAEKGADMVLEDAKCR